MESLQRLCYAVRAITPHGEIRLWGEPSVESHWHGSVVVGGIIIIEVEVGPIEEVVPALLAKLEGICIRMQSTLKARPES